MRSLLVSNLRFSSMTNTLSDYMSTDALAAPLPEAEARRLAGELGEAGGGIVYPHSIVARGGSLYFLIRDGERKRLGVISAGSDASGFDGEQRGIDIGGRGSVLTLCPTSPANAEALRRLLPFLVARPLGLALSAGCGDRLGLATPGHVRAIRKSSMQPIFAQQSIRENSRTGRTPQEVMDDALWGVFQEGWRDGFGADADHLKTKEDFDSCAAAGYTFFTVDPGAHVDNAANTNSIDVLRHKNDALPWDVLEDSFDDARRRYTAQPIDLGAFKLTIDEEELSRAAAKYGRAVAHTVSMYRHLANRMSGCAFEVEMSVDETDTITTLAEHVYIASELRRLGVAVVSLAPRYVGSFEKGVDYIGDLAEFERSFRAHFAVSQAFGPYKLSLHSGSDKFRLYPVASRVAGELVHLKTAGTSYLEALRAIAMIDSALFREIARFAAGRYPTDRATYHVSAQVERMPDIDSLPDDALTSLLDDFHAREILHVTFGSVLNNPEFRARFFAALRGNEETYYDVIERHFDKHFASFGDKRAAAGD